MPKLDLSIIGKKFDRLTVTDKYWSCSGGTEWLCECECGNTIWVYRGKLTSGHTSSCGCKNRSLDGLSNHKLYKTWWGIKERCYRPEYNASYQNYGGRGIIMCEEWHDFMNFFNWSIENGWSESLSIDRVNENGDYSPENCRWISLSENVARSNVSNPRHLMPFLYYGISPNGERFEFPNANLFAEEHNLNANALRRVARGERNHYKQWKFGFTNKPNTNHR